MVAVVVAIALADNARVAVVVMAAVVAVVAVVVALAVAVVVVVVMVAAAVATVAATKTARTALLAGATGLVGRELLDLLLADPRYSAVHCVGRRAPAVAHAKLVSHVMDFSNAAQLAALPQCDDVYIALGTTIKAAGS